MPDCHSASLFTISGMLASRRVLGGSDEVASQLAHIRRPVSRTAHDVESEIIK